MQVFADIKAYLAHVGEQRHSEFGRRFRTQFRDSRGTAELAMLAAPTQQEYGDFCRVVEAMTDKEKQNPEQLSDEDVRAIAQRGHADPGNVSIFLNGYILAQKEASKSTKA